MATAKFNNLRVKVKLPFLDLEGNWEIDETQRNAAWEIYVELVTRVTTAELKKHEGLLREALTSFYSMFGVTREILKKYGPSIAVLGHPDDITLGHIAVQVLNKVLRPLLAKWHPLLLDHENKKPHELSATQHEKDWINNDKLRTEIEQVRFQLIEYANVLAEVSGVSKLH
ncbi:MAG: hypothetical protein AAF847_17160 [Bacteroidota bacterium]